MEKSKEELTEKLMEESKENPVNGRARNVAGKCAYLCPEL